MIVEGVEGLYGYDVKLKWDPKYLAYRKHFVIAKWTLVVMDKVFPDEGWYWLACSKMHPEPPAFGTFPLFNMTFAIKQPMHFETGDPEAIDPIDTVLKLVTTSLVDVYGISITHMAKSALIRLWEKRYPLITDLNGDRKVDIYDVVIVCAAYSSRPGDPHWNPKADIAEPWDIVNIYDVVTVCASYGEVY